MSDLDSGKSLKRKQETRRLFDLARVRHIVSWLQTGVQQSTGQPLRFEVHIALPTFYHRQSERFGWTEEVDRNDETRVLHCHARLSSVRLCTWMCTCSKCVTADSRLECSVELDFSNHWWSGMLAHVDITGFAIRKIGLHYNDVTITDSVPMPADRCHYITLGVNGNSPLELHTLSFTDPFPPQTRPLSIEFQLPQSTHVFLNHRESSRVDFRLPAIDECYRQDFDALFRQQLVSVCEIPKVVAEVVLQYHSDDFGERSPSAASKKSKAGGSGSGGDV